MCSMTRRNRRQMNQKQDALLDLGLAKAALRSHEMEKGSNGSTMYERELVAGAVTASIARVDQI
jgi:hypothetical protein